MEKSAVDLVWVAVCAALVFAMQAGFLCVESGLTRSKNSINVALKNVVDFGLSSLLFWGAGFGLMFGASASGVIGTSLFLPEFPADQPWLSVFFLFQVMFCGTAITIISGAVAERMSFAGYLALVVLVSGLIYPVFGHWAWGGGYDGARGWLARLGFVDFAGSTVVHSVGGWAALAAALFIGPRSGRFPRDGPPRRIQGHNLPLAMLGAFILWVGWLGFNGGSTLGMNGAVGPVIVNTVLAGCAGLVAALGASWKLQGRPDVGLTLNGSLAGLVAITAACHAVSPLSALVIGAVGGLLALALDALLERLKIDDAVGAIPVHAGAGVWGTLAVALFGRPESLDTGLGTAAQASVQLLGAAVCAVFSFGLTWIALWALGRKARLRVTVEDERLGLNVVEHGATTELHDLFEGMALQARKADLSVRLPVEPFTEVGQIAAFYNRTMDVLEGTTARTQAMLRSTSLAVLECAEDGRIEAANPAAEALFGCEADALRRRNIRELLDGVSESAEPVELTGRRPDGAAFPAEAVFTRVEAGPRRFRMAIVQDITKRKRLDRMKDEFVSTVSHELRTPLTAIRGSLGLMASGRTGELPPKARGMLGVAHQSCERLVRLVNDILDVEKLSVGKMSFQLRPLEVGPLLRQAAEANRAFADELGVRIEVDAPTAGTVVRADGDRLMQVLTNLISNACKYSPKGDAILLRAERAGDSVRFTVADRGPGIPEEFRARIFQAFAQADGGDGRAKQGTGLGLAICKAIVERMGGGIVFESAPGRGTAFHFNLPEHREAPPPLPPGSLRPRILVCEDDPDLAMILRELLDRGGYDADIASSAGEAKQRLASGGYAAMTLDLALPDQNGMSLIRELRESDATRDLPVVVCSAYVEDGRSLGHGEAFGVADWIAKPIDDDRLQIALRRAVPAVDRPRILHVEDDPALRNVVLALLSDGAKVVPASDLAEARRLLEGASFDLVVLDLELPDGNGLDLLPRLRKTPVVVLSAQETTPAAARELSAVLLKSNTSNEELVATILDLVGRRKLVPAGG